MNKKQIENLNDKATSVTEENVEITQVTSDGNVVIHPVTKARNVKYGETNVQDALDKKVCLDGESQNFNFIENQVVQDGLVYIGETKKFNGNVNDRVVKETSEIIRYMSCGFILNTMSVSNGIITTTNDVSNVVGVGVYVATNTRLTLSIGYIDGLRELIDTKFKIIAGKRYKLEVSIYERSVKVTLDNKVELINCDKQIQLATSKFGYGSLFTDNKASIMNGTIFNPTFYNRPLTPQEIQHNVSVLNTTPSIKELHTTDANGKTSILKLGSDEDHVEMASGRTLREEYMGVLKTMGKEFVSPDGSPVEVNNGIEARVISAEIKGQTIKNYGVLTDKYYSFNTWTLSTDYVRGLQVGKTYYMIVDIKTPTTNGYVHIRGLSNKYITDAASIANKGGINILSQTMHINATQSDLDDYINCRIMYYSNGIQCDAKVLAIVETLEEAQKIKSFLGFGLSSTEAIISNNGKKYPIYEPTIQGKTRILKAPKGTQNWVEISDSEARDTVTYDYKLDSIAGDLGSVPSISDYIDRARKVKVVNTEQKIYSGLEDWWKSSLELGSYIQFGLDINANAKENTTAISDAIVTPFSYSQPAQQEQVIVSANANKKQLRITILKSKLVSQDVQGFKEWLQSNSVTVRYQLATPQEVQLTDEEFKAYDAHKKVISLPFAEDKLTLNEDGSAIWVNASDDVVFNGNEDWTWYNSGVVDNDTVMQFAVSNQKICGNFECAEYPKLTNKDDKTLGEGVFAHKTLGVVYTRILKNKLETLDASGLKKYLSQNNFTIRGNKLTPTTTHIPKELVPTILTHNQTNILEVGGAVKPSSFKVTVPVDKLAEIEARLQALESTTVDVVLNK